MAVNPAHLKRYKDIALLLARHGRADLIAHAGLEEVFAEGEEPVAAEVRAAEVEAASLAEDLEALGPTYIKLGQLLSTRHNLLPEPYTRALEPLQDSARPFPGEEAERIVEEELGVPVDRAFAFFDREPMAAASLGQVHRATLRDGRAVAVKVQRPGIRQTVHDDLEALGEIAAFMQEHSEIGRRYAVAEAMEQFRRAIVRELDYRQEAANLVMLGRNLAEFESIVVPAPVQDYTTSRVLTMDLVRGRKVTALSPLRRLELDGHRLADDLFRAYLQQILVDGFFHADPHPGNVFLTDDGRLALLDLGMMAHVTSRLQDRLLRVLLALGEGESDAAADVVLEMAERTEGFDERRARSDLAGLVARFHASPTEELQAGRVVLQLSRIAARDGLRLPPELALLGKTLLDLDRVARSLDPTFDTDAAIRRHAAETMRRRMLKGLSPGNVLSHALQMSELVEELPGRLNRLLDAAVGNRLELRVHAIDEARLMAGLQKIANRITLGLLLAALIVGAAMLMRVETRFQLFGYPGFAILAFILAAGGGVALAVTILMKDE